MSRMVLALAALFAVFASVNALLPQSALPSAAVSLTNIFQNTQGSNPTPTSTDHLGNIYTHNFPTGLIDVYQVPATGSATVQFTCAGANWNTASGYASSILKAFTVVTNNAWPTASTSSTMYALVCDNSSANQACKVIGKALAPGLTSTCPYDVSVAWNPVHVPGSATTTCTGGAAFNAISGYVLAHDPATGKLAYSCGGTTVFTTLAPVGGQACVAVNCLGAATTAAGNTGSPALSNVVGITFDINGYVWALANAQLSGSTASIQVLTNGAANFRTPNIICGAGTGNNYPCGQALNWMFAATQNAQPQGIVSDRSGNIYITFGGGSSLMGLVYYFNADIVRNVPSAPATGTTPAVWAYFGNAGVAWPTTVPSTNTVLTINSGTMHYDPYFGRLFFNNFDGFYYIPLIAVTFTYTGTPVGYDANGVACTPLGAACFGVNAVNAGVAGAATFNLRVYAGSVPGTAANTLAISFTPSSGIVVTQGFSTLTGGAALNNAGYSIAMTLSATGQQAIKPIISFTGSADSAFVFAAPSTVSVVAQGTITASSPTLSQTWPYSSNIVMANVPSTFTLTATPQLSTTSCSNAVINSLASSAGANTVYTTPAAISFSSATSTATVTVVHTNSGSNVWSGVFAGTGCLFTSGAAKVPMYNLAVTQTVNPSIVLTSGATFLSGASMALTSAAVNVQIKTSAIPGTGLGGTPTATFGSSIIPSTVTGCAGAFGSASASINTANYDTAGVSFTPSSGCANFVRGLNGLITASLAFGSTPATIASYYTLAVVNGLLVPTQLSAISGGYATFTTGLLTAPLSISISWDLTPPAAVTALPATQNVAPGQVVGPYRISLSAPGTAGNPSSVSVTLSDGVGGSYYVALSPIGVGGAYTYPTAPGNTATGFTGAGTIVQNGGSVVVYDNTYVWYRAPNYSTGYRFGAIGAASNGLITITPATNSFVTYIAGASTTNIVLTGIATLSFPVINSQDLQNIYAFAGRQGYNRNNVTLSVGYPVVAATQFQIAFPTPSAVNVFLGPAGAVPVLADYASNTPTLTVTVPAGQSSIGFVMAGGAPGETVILSVTRTTGDTTIISGANPSVKLIGQIRIETVPSQLLVNVPAQFQMSLDPIPAASYLLSISDTAGSGFPSVVACADFSRAAGTCSAAGANSGTAISTINLNSFVYNAANIYNAAFVGGFIPATGTFQLIYTPPATAVTGSAYPALGGIPTFTFTTADTNYIITVTDAVRPLATLTTTNTPAYKMQLGGNSGAIQLPRLQGSLAITFMNYDDATRGVPGNTQLPVIGVKNQPAGATYYYPLGVSATGAVDINAEGLPLPTSTNGPSYSFLSGQKYAIAVTTYPPVPVGSTLSAKVSYVDDANPTGITSGFDFNRYNSASTVGIGTTVPSHSSQILSIYQLPASSLTSTGLDAGVSSVATIGPTLGAAICPSIAQDSTNSNYCSLGFFWWTVPTNIIPGAAGAKLVFAVQAGSNTNYVTQSQSISVKQWCGLGNNFRAAINALSYGVATQITYSCTPGLNANQFLEIKELNTAITGVSNPRAFVPAQTTLPLAGWPTTNTVNLPAASGNWWFHLPSVTGDLADEFFGANSVPAVTPANTYSIGANSFLQFRVTTAATSGAASDPVSAPVRILIPVVGVYTIALANQVGSQPAVSTTSCVKPTVVGVTGNLMLPTPVLPSSVASTSMNTGTVCMWPFGTVTSTLSVSDGIAYTAAAALTVPGGAPTAPAVAFSLPAAGSIVPTAAGSIEASSTATVAAGGLPLTFTAAAATYIQGLNFYWNLNSASLQVANFSVCATLSANNVFAAAAGFAYSFGYGGCSATTATLPNTGVLPAYFNYNTGMQYRPLPINTAATPATQASTAYSTYSVPISVAMTWVSPNAGVPITLPRATAGATPPTPTDLIVGQTYTFELRTASTLISPAQSGLTVTVSDVCGIFTSGVLATNTPASITSSNPAGGQWSQTTLYYAPGETTKTLFYTPNTICAPVGANNYQLAFTVTVCTDASQQCTDGRNLQFVAPWLINFNSWGAVTVSGVPAQVAAGQTVNNIAVSVQPPLLPVASNILPGFIPNAINVLVADKADGSAASLSMGGSFISQQFTGASTLLIFNTTQQAPRAISYVAPTAAYFTNANQNNGVQRGISAVLSAQAAPYYRIVAGSIRSVFQANAVASPAPAGSTTAANFNIQVVVPAANGALDGFDGSLAGTTNPSATAVSPSIQGVFFNVVAGSSLSTATSTSLASLPDSVSMFVGNADKAPGSVPNTIAFNQPFVPGVNIGYFASVPFSQSAVVVNVATSSSSVVVSNNGWPAASGSNAVILPNAITGYVTPVFFLTPGLNTFLIAAASSGGAACSLAYGASATCPGGDGDGLVYRFTIARDTITNFGIYVAAGANAVQPIPWASLLTRLSATAQWVAPTGTNTVSSVPSLISNGPGSAGVTTSSFSATVDYGVQQVGIFATFYGNLRAKVSTNFNEAGSLITSIPNNQLVNFPLVVPTQQANVPSAATVITLLGGGLGPQTITINRAGKTFFLSGSGLTDKGFNAQPCIAAGVTSLTLSATPNGLPAVGGPLNPGNKPLTVTLTYTPVGGSATTLQQTAATATLNWAASSGNFASLAAFNAISFTAAQLPLTVSVSGFYPPAAVGGTNNPSEFSPLNYQLNYC